MGISIALTRYRNYLLVIALMALDRLDLVQSRVNMADTEIDLIHSGKCVRSDTVGRRGVIAGQGDSVQSPAMREVSGTIGHIKGGGVDIFIHCAGKTATKELCEPTNRYINIFITS